MVFATIKAASPAYSGGIYAMSQAEWKKAAAMVPQAWDSKGDKPLYATAAQAPESVQTAAFSAYLTSLYNSNGGSWASAVKSAAAGTPLATTEGSHLDNFATNIANQVNAQITAVQNEVNNSDVTTKVPETTQTDIEAEAAQAAKQADPVGYYSANVASWGGLLSKMAYGTPLTEMQSSADTFTGPVASEGALNIAPTTTTATAA